MYTCYVVWRSFWRVRSKLDAYPVCKNSEHGPFAVVFILSLGERTNIVHDSALIAFRIGASISKYVRSEKNTGKCAVCTINACFACYKSLYSGNFVHIMTMMLTWTYAFSVRSCDLFFLALSFCFSSFIINLLVRMPFRSCRILQAYFLLQRLSHTWYWV